jgi:hypothetical protein
MRLAAWVSLSARLGELLKHVVFGALYSGDYSNLTAIVGAGTAEGLVDT